MVNWFATMSRPNSFCHFLVAFPQQTSHSLVIENGSHTSLFRIKFYGAAAWMAESGSN